MPDFPYSEEDISALWGEWWPFQERALEIARILGPKDVTWDHVSDITGTNVEVFGHDSERDTDYVSIPFRYFMWSLDAIKEERQAALAEEKRKKEEAAEQQRKFQEGRDRERAKENIKHINRVFPGVIMEAMTEDKFGLSLPPLELVTLTVATPVVVEPDDDIPDIDLTDSPF